MSVLFKTSGIILRTTKYSETSLVARILTREFGIQSYLVQGARGRKAKVRSSVLQPLYLVEMVVYHRDNGKLQRISELRNEPVYIDIPRNPRKGCILMFLNELIYKSLKEGEGDEELFKFLTYILTRLDQQPDVSPLFVPDFLVKFSAYLGFATSGIYLNKSSVFDLVEGVFTQNIPPHPDFISGTTAELMSMLMLDSSNPSPIWGRQGGGNEIRELNTALLHYYQIHLPQFSAIKSLDMLDWD